MLVGEVIMNLLPFYYVLSNLTCSLIIYSFEFMGVYMWKYMKPVSLYYLYKQFLLYKPRCKFHLGQMESLYEKDPTKALEKGFKENYGKLMTLGGCASGSKLANFYTGFNYFITVLAVYYLIQTTFMAGTEEFGWFSELLHFIVLITNVSCSCFWYILNGKPFDNIYRAVGSGFYYYGDSFDPGTFNNFVDKQRYLGKQRKRKYTDAYIKLVVLVCTCYGGLRTLYEWMTGKYEYAGGSDGIVKNVPLPYWFPFDPESNLHFIGAAIFEYYNTLLVSLHVVCQEIPIISISEELCSEFQILANGIEMVEQRAIGLYKILYREDGDSNQMDKQRLEHCIKLCLKDSVRHHVILIGIFKDFRRVLFLPLASCILSSTLILCFSGILFTDDSVLLSVKLVFMVMLLSEITYTFIFCWYGQRIQDASCEICSIIYNTEWIKYSESVKRYLLIIQPCSQNPLKLTGAGFLGVELSTFLDICKSAFSYFSLFQALNES